MSDQQGNAPGSNPRIARDPTLAASGPWPPTSDTHEVIPQSRRSAGLKLVTISPGTQATETSQVTSMPGRHDPYIGCTIDDRYIVERVLGEGGMGVVYRCTHKIIGKKVAMKVLRADLARDAEVTERFLNEAKSASAIGNPHIIDISDFGQLPDGSTYFIMEYLDGVPLANAIEGGNPVPVPRILHIGRQLAEGLSSAHAAGIVHRDLKPDNIYLIKRGKEQDFIKILDFGIAKVSTAGDGKLTRAGAVFGTPHYMSPEQAAGAPIDHRGDIYSFGVILYEMASGKVPFDADNFMGILTQHMYKSPVPIRALVPQPQDVPPGLEAIVLKCLSKRPEQRYQSMDEIIVDFDKLREGTIPDAVSEMMARSGGFNVPADYFKPTGGGKMPAPMPATPAGVPRTKSRWPVYAGIAGVLAAIGIVVGIFAKSSLSTASPPPVPVAEPAQQAEPEIASRPVMLVVEPLDAHVFRGDKSIGVAPLSIDVAEGSTVDLRIVREGYKTMELKLDASEPRRLVKLEPLAEATATSAATAEKAAPPAPRPARASRPSRPAPAEKEPPKPKPRSNVGGGEIVNPWGD